MHHYMPFVSALSRYAQCSSVRHSLQILFDSCTTGYLFTRGGGAKMVRFRSSIRFLHPKLPICHCTWVANMLSSLWYIKIYNGTGSKASL
jgi:hypothetical protein